MSRSERPAGAAATVCAEDSGAHAVGAEHALFVIGRGLVRFARRLGSGRFIAARGDRGGFALGADFFRRRERWGLRSGLVARAAASVGADDAGVDPIVAGNACELVARRRRETSGSTKLPVSVMVPTSPLASRSEKSGSKRARTAASTSSAVARPAI